MNYWFTSDWHLSHENLMNGIKRPFHSIEEMNDHVISNFYNQIKAGDQVYFLGDFSWDKKVANDFLSKLPKNINFHFIYGNHDKGFLSQQVLNKHCASVSWLKDIKIGEQKITLCHYLMKSWDCSHYNAWHLHGHHHVNTKSIENGKIMNVCIDVNNYKMINYDEVCEYMKNCPDNWDLISK